MVRDEELTSAIQAAAGWSSVSEGVKQAAVRAFEAGRAAWPACDVPPGEIGSVLGVVAAEADDPIATIDALHAADLWLATACARGARVALDELDSRLQSLRPALRRVGLTDPNLDDFLQDTRIRLVARADDRPARILSYQGRAGLRAWLKVVVVRDAIRAVRRDADDSPADREIDVLLDPTADPELAAMKETYARSFRAAFAHALAQLSPRDRTLLRCHLVDGLTIDDLGAMHRVHRATAARWLVHIRERLYGETRDHMMRDLVHASHEFDGVLGLIRSRMDASIARRLRSNG